MNIGVGSKNITKVQAVEEILKDYPLFASAQVHAVNVQIEEFGHPKNINEVVAGATDRAKQAQQGNDYGFGIEGGLMEVPGTKTGYMEVAACAIYDGTQVHLGLSPACEWPAAVIQHILHDGLDGSQAMKAAGITSEEKLGASKGFIDLATKGRMDRTAYNKAAVVMALIHLENPDYF